MYFKLISDAHDLKDMNKINKYYYKQLTILLYINRLKKYFYI